MNTYKLIAPDWFSQNIPHFKSISSNFLGKSNITYLEIGVWEGRSLVWVLDNILTGEKCKVYAIDPWIPYGELNQNELYLHSQAEENFDYNLKKCLAGRNVKLNKLKMKSCEALRGIDSETVDLAYIDGSHSAPDVLEDLINVWRVLKVGGVVICDDVKYGKFKNTSKDPQLAASAFLDCHKDDAKVIAHNYALVMRKQ